MSNFIPSVLGNGESAGSIRTKLNQNFQLIAETISSIGFVWQGTYNPSTQYVKGDVVYYGSALHIAKTNTINLSPDNTSAWDFLLDGPLNDDASKENIVNKSINVITDQASNVKYPSVKAVYDWVTSDGASKENIVNKSINVITDQASNVKYPSVKAVYDWVTSAFAKYSGDADFYKYSIVRTVSSGNLTVALKNYEGNDPTSTKPVKIQIGDTIRTITSALSFTNSAGFNWGYTGSTELATKEVDWFCYFVWRTGESTVKLTASRIPYATIYGDFNMADATTEKGNLGNFGSPVSTDPVVNIGRFNAILSGGAGYTWSIPATSTVENSPKNLSGTNTGDVTLAGTPNYITIAGQVITRALIDLTTHVTGLLPFANIANVATGTVMYRKTASTGPMEAQTLATLKTDLGLTGTNSGDQTSIVGITGTLSQFNTACTDADFATGGGTATGTNTGDQTSTAGLSNTTNKNLVTDAQLTVIGNTSGTNTGDNAPNTNSGLVHTTGVETIGGNKTFSNDVSIGGSFTVGSQIWSSGWTSFTATPTWSGGTTDPTMIDSQSAYKWMGKTLHIKIWLFYSGGDRTGATILLPTTVSSSGRTIFASWSTRDGKPFFPYAFNSQNYINCSGFTQSGVAELYISGTCETA